MRLEESEKGVGRFRSVDPIARVVASDCTRRIRQSSWLLKVLGDTRESWADATAMHACLNCERCSSLERNLGVRDRKRLAGFVQTPIRLPVK